MANMDHEDEETGMVTVHLAILRVPAGRQKAPPVREAIRAHQVAIVIRQLPQTLWPLVVAEK